MSERVPESAQGTVVPITAALGPHGAGSTQPPAGGATSRPTADELFISQLLPRRNRAAAREQLAEIVAQHDSIDEALLPMIRVLLPDGSDEQHAAVAAAFDTQPDLRALAQRAFRQLAGTHPLLTEQV